MSKDLTFFAQRLRVAIAASGMFAQDLARACEVSSAAVSKWTSGKAAPSPRHLMTISKLTGASVNWLMTCAPVDMSRAAAEAHRAIDVLREAADLRDLLTAILPRPLAYRCDCGARIPADAVLTADDPLCPGQDVDQCPECGRVESMNQEAAE
jgi:transcriptional regulator with XRE-family HTH domain